MAPKDVDRAIDLWLQLFSIFRDERRIFSTWRELVQRYNVKGKAAHDARIIAAMERFDMEGLLTFNVSDFKRYQDIHLFDAGLLTGK